MSLTFFEIVTGNKGFEDKPLAKIKEKTGVEITNLTGNSNGFSTYDIRFPNMETAQKVRCEYFNKEGTVFVDVDNHFLMLTTNSGAGYSEYVNGFFPVIIFGHEGCLYNVCYQEGVPWDSCMNSNCSGTLPDYQGNNVTKNDITLIPLRVYAYNLDLKEVSNDTAKAYIRHCYVNYERKFQRGLKFIDQNGNEFITLGGYLLYYNGKHK